MAALAQASAAISISLNGESIRVTGVNAPRQPPDWSAALTVTVDQPDAPPLRGAYRLDGGTLIFTPRYPFAPGLAYRARFDWQGQRAEAVLRAASANPTPTATVESIFPSPSEWPENLLRFYLHFSAPMSRGEAFARLHLIDAASNTEVRLPFLEIHEELWDRDQRRLTVLFDPGRVKRGLVPHNEVGPPLVAGRRYRLQVDAEWRDARNRPLRQAFTKEFAATPAIRLGIDPSQWKLTVPRAGTRDPLLVDFPRPLDAGLLQSCLTIAGIQGVAQTLRNETRWEFLPAQPWAPHPYRLTIGAALEDVAGNRLGRAFDVDLDVFDRVKPVSTAPQGLSLTPRP